MKRKGKVDEVCPGEACRGNGAGFYNGAFLELAGIEGRNKRKGEMALIS